MQVKLKFALTVIDLWSNNCEQSEVSMACSVTSS